MTTIILKKILIFFVLLISFGLANCGGNNSTAKDGNGHENDTIKFADQHLVVALVNQVYAEESSPIYLEVEGGSGSYSWVIEQQNIPLGLVVSGDYDSLWISGTPTETGDYSFNVSVTDSEGNQATSTIRINVVDEVDLSGGWTYSLTPLSIDSECTLDSRQTHNVTVSKNGNEYTFSGFFSDPLYQLVGTYSSSDPGYLTITGSYPEQFGTTQSTHVLEIYSNDLISGLSDWNWTYGGSNTCSDSQSQITASRVQATSTYSIGPSRTYRQFDELPILVAGDVVEVDGGFTYDPVRFDDYGSGDSPIRIVGLRSAQGQRPIISGGVNTVEFAADHYEFEGFEVTGASYRCIYHRADDITIRDSVIHDCIWHGILGADQGSGSLLLEYAEVYNCGEGTRHHQIYMTTDQIAHPGSTFRMQFCYLHDGNGGNGVKSRSERNEIYYNWIEGSYYHEIELIGPDPGGTPVSESANIENSDVVGNVLVKTGNHWVARFGGDGTGQTNGRYRFAYNTVILSPEAAGVFRIFDGIESLEAHNNVFHQTGAGSSQLLRDAEANWVDGIRRVTGENNFVVEGTNFLDLPAEWSGVVRSASPDFESLVNYDFRPAAGSPLINAAEPDPQAISGYAFPTPEESPQYHPPVRELLKLGNAQTRQFVGEERDIGAFESSFVIRPN